MLASLLKWGASITLGLLFCGIVMVGIVLTYALGWVMLLVGGLVLVILVIRAAFNNE